MAWKIADLLYLSKKMKSLLSLVKQAFHFPNILFVNVRRDALCDDDGYCHGPHYLWVVLHAGYPCDAAPNPDGASTNRRAHNGDAWNRLCGRYCPLKWLPYRHWYWYGPTKNCRQVTPNLFHKQTTLSRQWQGSLQTEQLNE